MAEGRTGLFQSFRQEEEEKEEEINKNITSRVGWLVDEGLKLGKKVVITGVVISSASLVVPPLMVVSALGFAFSVPFGIVFISYACTEKLMSKLLPAPPLSDPFMTETEQLEEEEAGIEGEMEGEFGEGLKQQEEEEEEEAEDLSTRLRTRIEEVASFHCLNKEDEGSPDSAVDVEIGGLNEVGKEDSERNKNENTSSELLVIDEPSKTRMKACESDDHEGRSGDSLRMKNLEHNLSENQLSTRLERHPHPQQNICGESMETTSRSSENATESDESGLLILPANINETSHLAANGQNMSIKDDGRSSISVRTDEASPSRCCYGDESDISSILDSRKCNEQSGIINICRDNDADRCSSPTVNKEDDASWINECKLISKTRHGPTTFEADTIQSLNGGSFGEKDIWKHIDAMRVIVGYRADRQTSYSDELKALYVFTGVEPPTSFSDSPDIALIYDQIRFLMSIVGVK